MVNYYEVLGLNKDDEITDSLIKEKAEQRTLVLTLERDDIGKKLGPNVLDEEETRILRQRIKEIDKEGDLIREAYNSLKSKSSRDAYDIQLLIQNEEEMQNIQNEEIEIHPQDSFEVLINAIKNAKEQAIRHENTAKQYIQELNQMQENNKNICRGVIQICKQEAMIEEWKKLMELIEASRVNQSTAEEIIQQQIKTNYLIQEHFMKVMSHKINTKKDVVLEEIDLDVDSAEDVELEIIDLDEETKSPNKISNLANTINGFEDIKQKESNMLEEQLEADFEVGE